MRACHPRRVLVRIKPPKISLWGGGLRGDASSIIVFAGATLSDKAPFRGVRVFIPCEQERDGTDQVARRRGIRDEVEQAMEACHAVVARGHHGRMGQAEHGFTNHQVAGVFLVVGARVRTSGFDNWRSPVKSKHALDGCG